MAAPAAAAVAAAATAAAVMAEAAVARLAASRSNLQTCGKGELTVSSLGKLQVTHRVASRCARV